MLINGVNVCGASRYHPACWAGVTSAPLRRCAVVISSTSSRVWYDHAEAMFIRGTVDELPDDIDSLLQQEDVLNDVI